jgi:hypothetical protein
MQIITCSSAVSTNVKGVFGIGSINTEKISPPKISYTPFLSYYRGLFDGA